MFAIAQLTVEYRTQTLGIENRHPRFGWQILDDMPQCTQKSYRVQVATAPKRLDTPDCWDSQTVMCDRSEHITYDGVDLQSAGVYFVRVTVESARGETAVRETTFEMAPFAQDFAAKWIAMPQPRNGWSPYFRHTFRLTEQPQKARLYFCGLGFGEAFINGQRVSEDLLEPINSNFEKQVYYAAYDITAALHSGENAIGAQLGCGFYNQDRVWKSGGYAYGGMKLLAEIRLQFADGTQQVIGTDENWLCDFSPITLNNIYGGETYDARLEQPGWCTVDFDADGWRHAVEATAPAGELLCRQMPPIRRYRTIKPVAVTHPHHNDINADRSRDQIFIVDMGENFAGWVKIHIPPSPAGAEYVLRFAERLQNGSLDYTTCGPYHTCLLQQDRYIAKGDPNGETFEPRFTYHGFQFIEITGVHLMSTALPDDFIEAGYAVNTAFESAGTVSVEHPLAEKLQTLGRHTVLSNFHGFPEDCPVREKCGWQGDAQLVSETVMNNFNAVLAYEKYLEDIRTTKEVYGTWQMVAPGKRTCGAAAPLWGSAQVVIPWNLYLYYNDRLVLEKYYPLMKEWVEHETARCEDGIIHSGLGDWCPPGGNGGTTRVNTERIPVPFSSTAEYYHVTVLTAKIARVLGQTADAENLETKAAGIAADINRHFLDRTVPTYGTLGADGVALAYGFCPENLREAIAKDAVQILNVRCGGGFHTGIFGNKYTVPVLTEMGYGDDMLASLFHPEKTSFATMMAEGAGSIWESLDDRFGHTQFLGGSGSMNHPMHFAFGSWYYTHLLGIRPREEAPGFKCFTVCPYPLKQLAAAHGERVTPYGTVRVNWRLQDGVFTMDLSVPANTSAVCALPGKTLAATCGGVPFTPQTVFAGGRVSFTAPSGEYHFVCR